MNHKAELLFNTMKEMDIHKWFEVNTNEEDESISYFFSEQKIGGQLVKILFVVDEEVLIQSCQIQFIEGINNPLKRDALLSYINELNTTYRLYKFAINDDGNISAYVVSFAREFDPKGLIQVSINCLQDIEKVLPKFMKIVWA